MAQDLKRFYEDKAISRNPREEKRRLAKAARFARVQRGSTVLDLGCGGCMLREFLDPSIKYYGIDIAERFRVEGVIIQEVCEGLEFDDGFFDFVFCLELLEHVRNPYFVLCETGRVLKPEGFLILSIPNPYHFKDLLESLLGLPDRQGHIFSWTPQAIGTLLSVCGFEIVDKTGTYFAPRWAAISCGANILSRSHIYKIRKQASFSGCLVLQWSESDRARSEKRAKSIVKRLPSGVVRIVQIVILGVIFFFLTKTLYGTWREFADYHQGGIWAVERNFLVLSLAALLIQFPLFAILWNKALVVMTAKLGWRQTFRVVSLALLARYVPGSIWNFVGQIYLCERQGIPRLKTMASILLQWMLILLTGSLLFMLSLPFWVDLAGIEGLPLLLVLTVIAAVVPLYPPLLNRMLTWAFNRWREETVRTSLKTRSIAILMLYTVLMWVSAGLGLYFFARSLYPLAIADIPPLIGIYAMSWIIGFLSFLTPMGLGVREGTLAFLLKFFMPLPSAILVALAFRVWDILRELLCVGLVFGYDVLCGDGRRFWDQMISRR